MAFLGKPHSAYCWLYELCDIDERKGRSYGVGLFCKYVRQFEKFESKLFIELVFFLYYCLCVPLT